MRLLRAHDVLVCSPLINSAAKLGHRKSFYSFHLGPIFLCNLVLPWIIPSWSDLALLIFVLVFLRGGGDCFFSTLPFKDQLLCCSGHDLQHPKGEALEDTEFATHSRMEGAAATT